ncbi:hypothetical protein Tco_0648161 [Tanacetum coccineum]
MTDHLIRRIHQLDTTYQTFYPEQRIEFYSLNNVSVLPNNTAYSVNSIRRTGNSTDLYGVFQLIEYDVSVNCGSEHEDANEHIENVLDIVDLFHILKMTQDQIMLRAFPVSLTGATSRCFQQEPDESLFRAWERFKELLMKCPQHYLTDMQEVILFYNGLDVLTRQILDSKGAIPSKTATDAKIAIQEMAEYSQKWQNGKYSRTRSTKTSDGLAVIQSQLNNLGREIKKVNKKVYAAQFGAPYQPGGQYRTAGPGFYQRNNGNSSYPDRRPSLEESLTKFMAESAKRHEENSNIIKEIRASTDAAIRNQGASIKTLET